MDMPDENTAGIERPKKAGGRGEKAMSNYTFGAKTVCPFYVKEAGKSITCEGLSAETANMTRFESSGKKELYQTAHCETYEYADNCPLAAALMRKYG